MKRFLKTIILFFIPLICIPVVNISIDPSNVYAFSNSYEKRIVSLLQSHKYVEYDRDRVNDREVKKLLIDSCKYNAEIVVVGSSRVRLISSEMLSCDMSLINLAVAGATYEDMAALLYHYIKSRNKPQIVIIGIDPQHFNQNIGDTRWTVLQKEYSLYSSKVLHQSISCTFDYDKWINLISLKYFQASCIHIYNDYILDIEEIPVSVFDTMPNFDYGFGMCCDGSSMYDAREPKTTAERQEQARSVQYGQWNNYFELSKDYQRKWQIFVDFLKDMNIEIYFSEAAYHPITYKRLMTEEKNKEMKHAMDYINEFAHKNSIKIIGSYNPSDFHLEEDDFVDGLHMRKDAVMKYIGSCEFQHQRFQPNVN